MLPAQSRLWRGQEYRADAAAAAAGYAPGLRQAVTYPRGSFDGQRSGWDRTLLASHPPNELRLERLEDDGRVYPMTEDHPLVQALVARWSWSWGVRRTRLISPTRSGR